MLTEANLKELEVLEKIKEIRARQQTRTKYYSRPKLKENCEVCGSSTLLQRHHIKYDPPEIITVCYKCHCLIHNRDVGTNENQYTNEREKWRRNKATQRAKKQGLLLTDSELKTITDKPDHYDPEATPEERLRIKWRRNKRVQRARQKERVQGQFLKVKCD